MSDTPEGDEPSNPTLAQPASAGEGRIGYGRYARFTPLGLALVIVAVVTAVWWSRSNSGSDTGVVGGFSGRQAPDVTLTTFSGNTVRLLDLTGSVVVINFWAEWCAPCKEEMPVFQEVYEQTLITREPVVFLGVDLKSDREENALRLIEDLGITYITGHDSGGDDPLHGPIQQAFGIPESYPVTIFIRPDGTIDTLRVGAIGIDELRERMKHAAG
jgi:cytochrome c biogenesis protein CcmG, thiol:disulfide interchange protein DsbE